MRCGVKDMGIKRFIPETEGANAGSQGFFFWKNCDSGRRF